jgi:hypothetical protein
MMEKKITGRLVILVRKHRGPLLPSFRWAHLLEEHGPVAASLTQQLWSTWRSVRGGTWEHVPLWRLATLTFALPFDLFCMKGPLTQALSQPVDTRRKLEGTEGSRDHIKDQARRRTALTCPGNGQNQISSRPPIFITSSSLFLFSYPSPAIT